MLKQMTAIFLVLGLVTFKAYADDLDLELEAASPTVAPVPTETPAPAEPEADAPLTLSEDPVAAPAPTEEPKAVTAEPVRPKYKVIDEREYGNETGKVTIEHQEDYSKDYKQRRGNNGALFSITAEKFYPSEYYSLFADAGIADIVQDDRATLIGIELGYKRNFSLGSVAVLGNYSQGGLDGTVSGLGRSLSFVKQGISVNYAADVIFNNPYVVPYVQAGLHQVLVTESNDSDSMSASSGFALNYRFGALFQLDWLEDVFDDRARADRMRSSGLENTYLDVYMTQYMASSNAADASNPTAGGDPNLSSSGELGIGLKLEF